MSGADFTPWPAELALRYRQRGYWQNQTLGAFLRELAARHGERIALVCGERRWSYAALDRRADQVAAGLRGRGLQPGERIVVQLPNVGEFFVACFACFRAGLIPVLALPGHRRAEITAFCELTQAAAYITVDRAAAFDYRELAREVKARAPTLRDIFIVGEPAEFSPFDSLYVEPQTLAEGDAGGIALLQLSGGSTGTPKLIPRTHDDYLYSVRGSVEICGFDADTVFLVTLPAAHNFPLSSPGSLGALLAGGRIVLSPQPEPQAAFKLIAAEQVTHAALVPALLLVWLEAAATERDALRSLKLIQVGGASLAPDVAQRVRPTLGCALQQVFGMAEGLVNYTRLDDDEDRVLNTQGLPISPDDEIRIVDDDDHEVPPGEVGHLLTRGPYTVRGYWRAAEHNLRAFTPDGYYRTGDRVRQRADGYLQVVGRAKDQINRGGEKIAVEEVEHHLLSHPRVRNAALVSVPDAWLGERSCAFVELAPQADDEPAIRLVMSLKLHLRNQGLATYKIPDRIEFLDRLPLTAPGKVAKQILRARADALATRS
jgi:2,3-dihydroxybenzoate-AMP ligase